MSARSQIHSLIERFMAEEHSPRHFIAGETLIPVTAPSLTSHDLAGLIDASLDLHLTHGKRASLFERSLSSLIGARSASLVNSGSSANLLAIASLTSPKLKDARLTAGDEVITTAACFPTTINPLLQHSLIPVFIDITLPTLNVNVTQLEAALSPRTRAVMLTHTLGNPFDVDAVQAFCQAHDLWLIEDCCDALGSSYCGRMCGGFGDLSTFSFYPAHHITMGEGGAVATSSTLLKSLVESFRDWGRDCWCAPGTSGTCGRRFTHRFPNLPEGYDHKYTYSHIGYNLKSTDLQASLGLTQLERLSLFTEARRANFSFLHDSLLDLQHLFVLPHATPGSSPSWFGFPLLLRPHAPFPLPSLIQFLQERRIDTRPLFSGNITRQPAYADSTYRIASSLACTDEVMHRLFWIGCHPSLTEGQLTYMIDSLHDAALCLPT